MLGRNGFIFGVFALLLYGCAQDEKTDWVEVDLQDHTYFTKSQAYRDSTFEILVLNHSALEFKIGMKKDDVIVYHWRVDMDKPQLLSVEFHGHTQRVGEEPGTVMFYKKHKDGLEQGALVAPFDGIHGWYLKNESDEDIFVKLSVAGFFEEINK